MQVRDLRIGEHPGSTRLVLDAGRKAAYTADLDNDEHLLVVELPDTGWAGAKKGAPTSPLISSWSVQPLGDEGSRLIVQLKKGAKITGQNTLSGGGSEPFKIVIDLAGEK
jgi:hypothetical protein